MYGDMHAGNNEGAEGNKERNFYGNKKDGSPEYNNFYNNYRGGNEKFNEVKIENINLDNNDAKRVRALIAANLSAMTGRTADPTAGANSWYGNSASVDDAQRDNVSGTTVTVVTNTNYIGTVSIHSFFQFGGVSNHKEDGSKTKRVTTND